MPGASPVVHTLLAIRHERVQAAGHRAGCGNGNHETLSVEGNERLAAERMALDEIDTAGQRRRNPTANDANFSRAIGIEIAERPEALEPCVVHRRRIVAHVFDFNPTSARVLEKCGFREEGFLRDHFSKDGKFINARLFARLKTDD